jgi:hypothetical protein
MEELHLSSPMGVMRCQRMYKPTTYDNTEIKRKKEKE